MSLSDRLNLYREWHSYDRWDGRRQDRDWYRDRWDGRYGRDGRDHRYYGRDRW